MSITADTQPRGHVEAVYGETLTIRATMSRHGDHDAGLRRIDGVLATVGWALGRSLGAPVSECRRYTPDALATELQRATTELDRTPGHDRCQRSYLTAVRDTLHWLNGDTETLPL